MGVGLKRVKRKNNPYEAACFVSELKWTIGPDTSNVLNVGIQFCDANYNAIGGVGQVRAYLSDNPDGSTLTGTTPNGSVAIGTNGVAIPLIAKQVFELISNKSGQVDLNIGNSTGHTFYLVVLMPDGAIRVSPAIVV